MNRSETIQLLFLGVIVILLSILGYQNSLILDKLSSEETIEVEIRKDSTINLYNMDLTPENFEYVCLHYDIEHPEIVYAQAKLESGYFTSPVYKFKNNFLGLYDSKNKDYYSFSHWSDCLKGYKDYVQRKWNGNGDYYLFLQNLPYAEDPNYIKKVKYLVNNK